MVVEDDGQGMTPEQLNSARTPFFTTRPTGTGLGLPIVASNIRNMELLEGFVRTAKTKKEFVRSVERCLSKPRMRSNTDYARKIQNESWERRVETILSHISAEVAGLAHGTMRPRSGPS